MTDEKNAEASERPLDLVVRLLTFEGSDALGNGDFSLLKDAAYEIARLHDALENLEIQAIRDIAPGWIGIPAVEWDSIMTPNVRANLPP